MKEQSKVVNCRGCGGTGEQGYYGAFCKPHDCGVCGGTGKKRMEPGESWCGRCGGKGQEEAGSPGFERQKRCHICGGSGVVEL